MVAREPEASHWSSERRFASAWTWPLILSCLAFACESPDGSDLFRLNGAGGRELVQLRPEVGAEQRESVDASAQLDAGDGGAVGGDAGASVDAGASGASVDAGPGDAGLSDAGLDAGFTDAGPTGPELEECDGVDLFGFCLGGD